MVISQTYAAEDDAWSGSRSTARHLRWRSDSNWPRRAIGPTIYLCIAFALMAHAWTDPTRILIGNSGDPDSYLWDLQWPSFAIPHGLNPFFTFYLIAPSGSNLAWSASLGPGVVLMPLVAILGPLLTYNLLATISLALSAWCAQLAIKRIVPSQIGAVAGGLLFGFSPYMTGHAYGHVAITLAFLAPLTLLLLHEMLVRQQWRWWISGPYLGVIFVFELVTFVETVAIVVAAAVIVVVLVAVQVPRLIRPRAPYALKAMGAAAFSFVFFGAYPLRTLIFGAQRLGHGSIWAPTSFVIDLANFVIPTVTTRFEPSLLAKTSVALTNGVESGGYIGVPLLLICVIAVIISRRRVVVRTAAIAGLLLAALALGPQLRIDNKVFSRVPLPFDWLMHVPLFRSLLAARFMGVVDLCVAVLVAEFVAVLSRARLRWQLPGAALLVVGLVAIVPTPLPLPSQPYAIPAYFTGPAVRRIPNGSTVLVAPFVADGSEIEPELWQAASGFRFKMPEGYVYVPTPSGSIGTGPIPTPLATTMQEIAAGPSTAPVPQIDRSERASYLSELRSWDVTTVLVGPMPNEQLMVAFLTRLLKRPGELIDGVVAWYRVNP